MNKEEMIIVLMTLSRLEGYTLGKVGEHIPEPLATEVVEAAEILAKYIKESA